MFITFPPGLSSLAPFRTTPAHPVPSSPSASLPPPSTHPEQHKEMPSKTSYLFLLPQTPRTLHTYNRHKPTRHLVHWDTLTLTIQSPDQSIQAHNPILCAPTPHRNSIIIEENISTTDETTITSHSTRHEKIKQKQTTHAQQVIFAEDIVKVTLADMEKQNKYRGHPYCFQIHTATGETVMVSLHRVP